MLNGIALDMRIFGETANGHLRDKPTFLFILKKYSRPCQCKEMHMIKDINLNIFFLQGSSSGGRRRGSQTLRTPSIRREADAPVTLRGWLLKQGSDGLMLWKKRWFVLSQYCLFYYHGKAFFGFEKF